MKGMVKKIEKNDKNHTKAKKNQNKPERNNENCSTFFFLGSGEERRSKQKNRFDAMEERILPFSSILFSTKKTIGKQKKNKNVLYITFYY